MIMDIVENSIADITGHVTQLGGTNDDNDPVSIFWYFVQIVTCSDVGYAWRNWIQWKWFGQKRNFFEKNNQW